MLLSLKPIILYGLVAIATAAPTVPSSGSTDDLALPNNGMTHFAARDPSLAIRAKKKKVTGAKCAKMGSRAEVVFTQAQVQAAVSELRSHLDTKAKTIKSTKGAYPKDFGNNMKSATSTADAVFKGAGCDLREYPIGPDSSNRSKLWSAYSGPPGVYRVVTKSDGGFKGVMQKGTGGASYYECTLTEEDVTTAASTDVVEDDTAGTCTAAEAAAGVTAAKSDAAEEE